MIQAHTSTSIQVEKTSSTNILEKTQHKHLWRLVIQLNLESLKCSLSSGQGSIDHHLSSDIVTILLQLCCYLQIIVSFKRFYITNYQFFQIPQMKKAQSDGTAMFCCQRCIESQLICNRYVKLVKLLRMKITQLEKKICLSDASVTTQQKSISVRNKTYKQQQLIESRFNLRIMQLEDMLIIPFDKNLTNKMLQSFNSTKTSQSMFFMKNSQLSAVNSSRITSQARAYNMVSNLTDEVVRLKSIFMHVRHCLYALLKEIQIQKQVGNHLLFNIFLALSNIFEFSEEEREEIMHVKKMKIRKRQKVGKQNIFKTVTEL